MDGIYSNLWSFYNVPKIKGKGNETGIESVQSHQKTSDLIEKEIRHFLRSSKKPAIYFKIPACGTESRKNLKVIYREIELLHLARTKTYHSSDLMGTTIISIVIDEMGKTKLNLGITPGLPILFLVTVLISSLIPLYIKKKKDWLIVGHRSGRRRGSYFSSSTSRLAHSLATLLSGSFSPGIVAQPCFST